MGISINGMFFSGKNVNIVNNKVMIDGKVINTGDEKEINIVVDGDIQNLEVDSCNTIEVKGNVGTMRNGSGDVKCGDVQKGVTSGSGNVKAQVINGDVQTGSGNVKCEGNISGNVKTGSGDVSYTKIESPMKN